MQKKPRVLIICACGCGQRLISVDKKGRDRKYIHGHNTFGRHWKWSKESRSHASIIQKGLHTREQNGMWNGGRHIDSWGYVWILCPDHPYTTHRGYMREHRLVMEQKIGRYLQPNEIPHHINGIKSDNRPENLELYPNQRTHIREAHFAENSN